MLVRWRMQLMADSGMQLLPCRRYSLDWSLSTFLSRFIRLFLTPPLKPCGYFTFLIMMKNFQFSPNLYTTARHVFRDLRKWRKCKLAFSSLGWRCWGWVYKKPISKWIPNGFAAIVPAMIMMKHVSFSPNLYTIACQFYVMFFLTFKREGHPVWTNWPTCRLTYMQKSQRRYAKNFTNLKLLTYVDCS